MLTISAKAEALIEGFEISDQSIYAASLSRPTWPGGASGVTIGIGYDLGYSTVAKVHADWTPLLGAAVVARLCGVVGEIGNTARVNLLSVRDIIVPYSAARQVFAERDIPLTISLVANTFRGTDKLSPDSLGALVSLVFNRGANCSNTPTRREMWQIQQAMAAGNYNAVPGYMRSMKRLWQGVAGMSGLLSRCDAQADLFEAGLGADAEPVVQVAEVDEADALMDRFNPTA